MTFRGTLGVVSVNALGAALPTPALLIAATVTWYLVPGTRSSNRADLALAGSVSESGPSPFVSTPVRVTR